MLDVHAPHEGIHTWRSFFTHIATISVGLLIAIGLEQSVLAEVSDESVAEFRRIGLRMPGRSGAWRWPHTR
jgi:hypothetical protein